VAGVNVENEMHDCVRSIGGRVYADSLSGSPDFANADYLLDDANTIGELKCLESDTRSEPSFQKLLAGLYASWISAGLVLPLPIGEKSPIVIDSRSLPESCAKQVVEHLRTRIRKRLIKASKQIESTKARLQKPNAKGLLLLANDGDMIFEPEVIFHVLDRLFMTGHYRAINTVTYFTVNTSLRMPTEGRPIQLWASCVLRDPTGIRESVPDSVLRAIQTAWFKRMDEISGVPGKRVNLTGSSPDVIREIRYPQLSGRRLPNLFGSSQIIFW